MSKVWLVTGSASGLGRNIAEAVLASGDRLIATARDPRRLEDLVKKHGDQVRTAALDVVNESAAQAASQKTHEIGVRMALGAGRGDILKMVLRQGLILVGAGLVAGMVLTFLAARGIGSLLVGVTPSDPVTLISVAVLLAAVGLVASYIPARRAMNIEPLRALKYE
jgi:NAD(P)-dependent dehydrogenase (short-subunit alcohol dehydrogenase family)